MKIGKQATSRNGFAILEALLAVSVCGVMTTGIVIAMFQIGKLSQDAKRQSALTRIIHNELMFATTRPRIQEGKTIKQVEEWDVEVETIITPLEDLIDQDGNVVNGIFNIQVNAVWWGDGDYERLSVETWRNRILYAN